VAPEQSTKKRIITQKENGYLVHIKILSSPPKEHLAIGKKKLAKQKRSNTYSTCRPDVQRFFLYKNKIEADRIVQIVREEYQVLPRDQTRKVNVIAPRT